MNVCLMVLCLALSSGPQQGRPAPDRWVAEDKWRHLFTSFTVTVLAAGASRAAGLDTEASAWVGASVGAGAGVWKELRDARTPGASPSLRDLAWDAAGVGAGTLVVLQGS